MFTEILYNNMNYSKGLIIVLSFEKEQLELSIEIYSKNQTHRY